MAEDIFQEINNNAKNVADNFEVEHAMQVNDQAKMVTAGVFISAERFDGPLFLSVDELRRLADEAEKRTIEAVSKM